MYMFIRSPMFRLSCISVIRMNIVKTVIKYQRRSTCKKKIKMFVKHYGMPSAATKSKKLFLASRSKSRSQVVDLEVI